MRSSYTTPEEAQELLSPSGNRKRSSPKTKVLHAQLGRGILINRYALLVLLAAVTVAGWYMQHQFIDLKTALQTEHDKVESLQAQMDVHQQVIERFNASITNTDVMNRLGKLEAQLLDTEQHLRAELAATEKDISDQLKSTVQELSTTVTQAEAEISDEVDKVKKDVEHYVLTTQDQFSMENSFMVYQLAGTFTLLSCLISMWHMTAHMRKMNEPDVQRRILAILWMSPVYAVTSWFSLVFHSAEGYLAIIKDGYEAYIIYQFLSFCIAVLGKGDRNKVVDLLAHHADHLTPPFRLFGCCEYLCGCCKPEPYENNRALADAILLQCQLFAMQFVLFRPLTTTAMVVLEKLKYYGAGDGPTDYRAPQFYITIIQNLSIFVAFTGLLKFYHAVDKELAWCRPFAKFLCIKGVVFMTFWQGLAISILAQTTDVGGQDEVEWAKSAQNFLICLEMLLFSIAHFHCFPTEEWQEGYRVKHQQSKFGDTIALGDFFNDVKLILQSKPRKKKKRRGPNAPKSARKLESVPEGKDDEHHDDSVEIAADDDSVDENAQQVDDVEAQAADQPGSIGTGNSEESDYEEEENSYTTASSAYENEYSFDDSQAAVEESDQESDEEAGLLSRRFESEGLSEEDRKIAKALEKSLGLAAYDPDIAEAARHLLDAKILSSEFFSSEMSDDEDVYRLYGADTKSNDGTDDDADAADSDDDEDEDNGFDDWAAQKIDRDDMTVAGGDINASTVETEDGKESNDQETTEIGDYCQEKCPGEAIAVSEVDTDRDALGYYGALNETVDSTSQESPLAAPDVSCDKGETASPERKSLPASVGNEIEGSSKKQETTPSDKDVDDAIQSPPRTPPRDRNDLSMDQISTTPDDDEPLQSGNQQSRNSSESGFWAFEEDTPTPVRATYEPAPLPTPNEHTPLLSRKSPDMEIAPESPTSLKPSIFTTVAALAEESDEEGARQNGSTHSPKKDEAFS